MHHQLNILNILKHFILPTMGRQKFLGMVVFAMYRNAYVITFKVWPSHIHVDPAIVGGTGGRLLLESSGVRPSHSILYPPWLRNMFPWGQFQGEEQSEVARSKVRRVWWLGDDRNIFSRLGIAAHRAKCGSMHYRVVETTLLATCRATSRNLCKTRT
jgi:hypothetical protein